MNIELGLSSSGSEFSYYIGPDCNNLIPYIGNPTQFNPISVDLTDYGWTSGDFCYKICDETNGCCCEEIGTIPSTPTPTPTITTSVTPTITPTPSVLLNRYFTTRCCDPGGGVMAAPSPGTYLADDGECYQTLGATSNPYTLTAVSNIGGCENCTAQSCPSQTPTPTITVTPSSSLDVVYEYFNSVSLCCNSTDTPISGVVGLNSNLGLSSGDYVVINGDAYQLGTSTASSGTDYLNASGPYTDCDDAVSNATNPCRYDMIPCCGSGSGPSYYPPFTLEIFSILTNGEAFFTTQVPPYQGITDKCMSVDTYTGNYSVDTTYPAVMQSNGNGCINRCSRCTFVVRPCGWPTNVYILWNVNTLPSMTAGTVWYDSGLSSWISTNFPGSTILLPTNCLTILPASEGSYAGNHDGYNYTINSVSNCSDGTC